MQIKELIIKNFKSFKYTTIPFKKGFQVVVGPNGSGKSNIVDALLFVFGETSLKKLRVDKLSDLVNHNSTTKTARVRVVFVHEDKEYEVVREIDDSGKSVFLLNNKRKALNEVTSFLSELGISSSGYNTVQQGDVTRIINQTPEERRKIIEDLSGISLFDERKKEAEDNLKKVDKRLDKVSIALNERKPYVEQLEKEKEDAINYKELDEEEKILNANLFIKQKEYYQKQQEIEQEKVLCFREEIKTKEQDKKNLLEKESLLEQKIEETNSKLISHSEKTHETIGKRHVECLSQKEIVQNNISLKNLNVTSLEKEKNLQEQEQEKIVKEINDIDKELKTLEQEISSQAKEKEVVQKKIEENKNIYDKSKKQQIDIYDKINKINLNLEDLQDQLFEKKNLITTYNLEKENFETENRKKKERKDVLEKIYDKTLLEKEELSKDIKKINVNIDEKTKELDSNLKKQSELVVSLAQKKATLAFLEKQKKHFLNIKENNKLVKQKLKNNNNFVGFLEEVVDLKDSEQQIYSRYLVFKENKNVDKVIEDVKEYGDFSFVFLDVLGVNKDSLKDIIKKKQINSKAKIKGYYFDGFCYKKISLKETEVVIKELEKEQKEFDKESKILENLKEKIYSDEETVHAEKTTLSEKQVSFNTKQNLLEDLKEKINQESKTTMVKNFTLNVGQTKSKLQTLEKEIITLKSKKQDLEKQLSDSSISVQENLRDQNDALMSKINDLKQRQTQLTLKKQHLLEKKINTKKYVEDNTTKQEKLKKDLKEYFSQEKELDNKIKTLEQEINEANKEKQNLYMQKTKINNELSEASKNLSSIDLVISDIRNKISETDMNINTYKNKLDQIEQNLLLFDDITNIKKIDLSLEEIQSRLRSVRREKNAIGNINFNAIDSYNKLAKEYHEISDKYNVLLEEKEQVKNMLYEINLKKQKIFMDCFIKINNEFKNVILKMSKHLLGNLELVGESPLTSKLLINLTKNNKTKNIDIMSGGEKSVTALAFIFAINTYKNYSFYVLDEVDAALDDINSKNLLNYIKSISETSTIVSISHNNVLFNGADQVIGVTLKDHSSVIGLNIK